MLLPGRALKNAAGAGLPALNETTGTKRARADRMPAEVERAGRKLRSNAGSLVTDGVRDDCRVLCRTRPKAHLTTGFSGERSESVATRG